MTSWPSGRELTFDPPRGNTRGFDGALTGPEIYQEGFSAKNIYTTQVNITRVAPNQIDGPAARTPRNDTAFRKKLATVLLRKLASTMDEVQWLDDELIELSVIVEDVNGYSATGRLGLRRRRGRYATRPLTEVIAHPETDLVLLQGAPGAGKSVALRQQAFAGLKQIESGRTPDAPLPIYVNLRELRVKPKDLGVAVLRKYIEQQIGPQGSTEITDYFRHHFDDDLRDRRVILLLDSFDEIPSVLGGEHIRNVVKPYEQTIIELVGGGGRCVVASRFYKAPPAMGWTRLQILGLSVRQQESFLRRLKVGPRRIELVQPLLTDPRHGFAKELQNPLNVKLLATHVKARDECPERPSALFGRYVSERLDAAWAEADRNGDDPGGRDAVEEFIAEFAFRLTSTGRGLSAPEQMYWEALDAHTHGDRGLKKRMIEALAGSKLLMSSEEASGKHRIFFCHRLVKEYLTSRYVTRHPSAVSSHELAVNGRWRETTVALLQEADSPTASAPLLEELADLLADELSRFRAGHGKSRRKYVPMPATLSWSSYGSLVGGEGDVAPPQNTPFTWSSEAVHCLELLTTAYQGRQEWPHEQIQPLVVELVNTAWLNGNISDRKFAIDCLPLLPDRVREQYIDHAFSGGSHWIRTTALRDCVTLPSLTKGIRLSIRRLLVTMLSERSLAAEFHAVDVDLQRLQQLAEDDLVKVRRVVSRIPGVVALICMLHILVGTFLIGEPSWWRLRDQLLWWYALPFFYFWWFQSSRPLSYGTGKSKARLFFERIVKRTVGLEMQDLDTGTLLSSLVLLTGLIVMSNVGWGIDNLVTGHPRWGAVEIAVYAPLGVYAMLWGPSVLYAVRQGQTARKLGAPRLVLAVPDSMRLKEHPVHDLNLWVWIGYAIGTIREAIKVALITSPLWGGLLLLKRFGGRFGHVAALVIIILLTSYMPLVVAANVGRALLQRRRVEGAFQRGRRGGQDFFDALYSCRDADEAADFVRRVRGTPGLNPDAFDRSTVRACIARLEKRLPELGAAALVSPDGVRSLTAWRGHPDLLNELGRLDEQLRPR